MISRAYASWRAECVKADIEMGFYKDNDTDLDIKNAEKRERRRQYMSEYYIRNREKILEARRKRKAAPLLAQEKRHNKK